MAAAKGKASNSKKTTQKTMAVRFFKTGDTPPFEDLLTNCVSLTPQERTQLIGGIHFRLEDIKTSGTQVAGNVVRVRDGLIPGKTRLDYDGVLAVDLKPNEYIGEETALLFDKTTGVLAIQMNIFGISYGQLARYLADISKNSLPVLSPVSDDTDITTRIKRLNRVKKLEVEVAQAGPDKLREMGFGGNELAGMMTDTGAQKLRLVLKPERGGSLIKVVEFVTKLFRFADKDEADNLRTAKIEGYSPDGQLVLLDLLEPKMVEHATFDVQANVRHVSYADRRNAVAAAWAKRQKQLEDLFGRRRP